MEEVDTLREEVVMEEGGEEEVDMVEEVVVVMEEEEEGEVMEEWVVTVGWRFSLRRALDGARCKGGLYDSSLYVKFTMKITAEFL